MVNNNNAITPIDPARFDNITEGKQDLQQQLLDIFFLNVEECLELMERICNDGYNQKWHDAAEELKNISDSLGAVELYKLCIVAENITSANCNDKKKVLTNIRSNVHKLRVYVRNTRY